MWKTWLWVLPGQRATIFVNIPESIILYSRILLLLPPTNTTKINPPPSHKIKTCDNIWAIHNGNLTEWSAIWSEIMQDLINFHEFQGFSDFILVFERHLKGNSAAKYEKKIIIKGGPPRKQLLSPHLLKA